MEKQKPAQEPNYDYGYDLVHEEGGPGQCVGRADAAHGQSGSPPEHPVELDGDYGYDEAHGF